jgi:hypothetical protein
MTSWKSLEKELRGKMALLDGCAANAPTRRVSEVFAVTLAHASGLVQRLEVPLAAQLPVR